MAISHSWNSENQETWLDEYPSFQWEGEIIYEKNVLLLLVLRKIDDIFDKYDRRIKLKVSKG